MDEKPDHNPVSDQFSQYLNQATETLLRLMVRLFQFLQMLWETYRSINWPDIPLTPIQWILLFYGILAFIFMVVTPIFEASDEIWHFGMIEYLVANDYELPVQDPENPETIYRQEGSQPPLYYYLSAALITPFDISDAPQHREINPHRQLGNPGNHGNKNHVLHPADGLPSTGTPRAVYWLRFVSIVMGAVTVFSVYQCGKLIAPHRQVVGLIAASITAFNPMFLFISASVNNDNLVIMLNSLVIWLALMTMREGFDLKRSIGIAFLLALATLTKLSALVLVPVIALGAVWVARRKKNWQGLAILGTAMLVLWAVIAGWWYWRNVQLYDEVFGTQMMAEVAGARDEDFTFSTMLSEFQGFRISYWGVFGGFNIQATPLYYAFMDFFIFVAFIGVLFLLAQLLAIRDFSFARRELTLLLFLLVIAVVGFGAFLNWTRITFASQGRLLFPFMAAISPLMAVGFVEMSWWILFLLSPPDRSFVRAGDAVPESVLNESMRWPMRFFGLIAILIPISTIAPHYRAPKPIDVVPEHASVVDADYGDIHLVAYDHADRRYFPGETVRITFYWQVDEQSEQDYSAGIAFLSPYGDRLGGIDTYPGAGTLRTSTWEPGKIYADTYQIPLARGINGRYPFRVQVNWYDEDPKNTLPITTSDGQEVADVVLDVGAVITPDLGLGNGRFVQIGQLRLDENGDSLIEQRDREFEDKLRIQGFNFDIATFTLDLHWEALSNLSRDYTAFAHIINEDGDLVGQADVFPELPTHYWRYGEDYVTTHVLSFFEEEPPPGEYMIVVGWYINDGETYPRLIIGIDSEIERDTFEMFPFTVLENGLIRVQNFQIEQDDEDSPLEDPQPEGTPDPDEGFIIYDPDNPPTEEVESGMDSFDEEAIEQEVTAEPEATESTDEEATSEPETSDAEATQAPDEDDEN